MRTQLTLTRFAAVLVTFTVLGFQCTAAVSAETEETSKETLDALIKRVEQSTQEMREINAHLRTMERPDLGIAGNENFTVTARAGNYLARDVLAQAEVYRQAIALAWLGDELPPGEAFAQIHVELSDEVDEGLTLLTGPRSKRRGDHRIWLTTSRERALGTTLAHELTHLVLSSKFPDGMPAWANEGIASLCDDQDRIQRRAEILADMVRRQKWPSLSSLLMMNSIAPENEAAYSVSVSLVEFLLTRGDRSLVLQFARVGQQQGWNQALQVTYGIQDTGELQQLWQEWVRQTAK